MMSDLARFQEAEIPWNEEVRLQSLENLRIMDTPAEERFDRIVRLIQKIFEVPIVYVALIEKERQWYKSKVGIDLVETPRNLSLCSHTILLKKPLIISDTRNHPISKNHPAVLGEPHLCFYAGWPLSPDGKHVVGSLCLIDMKTRELSPTQMETMEEFARLIEREMNLIDVVQSQEKLIKSQKELSQEQKKSNSLIRNIFPAFVLDEIRDKGTVRAKEHEQIFVLFSDFVDFTRLGEMMDPEELVGELSICFSAFDDICDETGVEKLKTIGDGYFCVTGLHELNPTDSASRLLECAFRMRDFISQRWEEKVMNDQLYWDIRIGLHCGKAIAGIVGKRKFSYDVWGDTVNTAARIESVCSPGKITASKDFRSFVNAPIEALPLGLTALKGKGLPLDLLEIERMRPPSSLNSHPLRIVQLGTF